MAKIERIKKSRKEQKCGKCGKVIPIGSEYLKAAIGFGPTLVRCTGCGLQAWQVTTSDYLLRIGSLQNEWQENYEIDADTCDSITTDIQELLDETQEKLDNMPEQLQESDTGCLLQERIESMETTIDELNNIDYEDYADENNDQLDEEKIDEYKDAIDEALGNLC